MSNESNSDIATVGSFAVLAMILSVITILIIITRGNSAPEGITGQDLRLAIIDCEPYDATFEQTLACYQAVYGNVNK